MRIASQVNFLWGYAFRQGLQSSFEHEHLSETSWFPKVGFCSDQSQQLVQEPSRVKVQVCRIENPLDMRVELAPR